MLRLRLFLLQRDLGSFLNSKEAATGFTGVRLTIRVNEYYKEIYAPVNRYEDYRKVINVAADFNKVVLVLER